VVEHNVVHSLNNLMIATISPVLVALSLLVRKGGHAARKNIAFAVFKCIWGLLTNQ